MRILVVEDDFLIADHLAFEIRQLGDEVVGPFPDISGAAGFMATADAAILDVWLRSGTSFALADQLEARHVPFLFLTGYDSHSIPGRFDNGRFYVKPSETRTLLEDLRVQRSRAVLEPTLENTVVEMITRACHVLLDKSAAERLVESVLRNAIARVEAGDTMADMHGWLLTTLDQECALRRRIHMH